MKLVSRNWEYKVMNVETKRRVYIPRSHQTKITNHILNNKRGAIFAGMGTGKTVATLTAIDILQITGYEERPTLVIAPLRVALTTWPDEVAKWDHLKNMKIVPIIGNETQRAMALRQKADVYTINYDNIVWLMDYLNGEWPFGMVVADESTKLKGFRLKQGAKRAKALARVAHSKVTRFINLTGTPAPNGLIDLWGQTWFIDAGQRLGRTFSAFVDRWFGEGYDGYSLRPLPHAQTEIEAKLKDICLSVDADLQVDEPIRNPIKIKMPKKAREIYDDMEREMFAQINGEEVEAFHAAARTMKCLQLANGAAYITTEEDRAMGRTPSRYEVVHDEKLHALEDVIEEAAGMPVLVAYHFRSDLERLKKHFPKGRELDKDPQTIKDWNAGKIPVMFAHPASAGHGLNLQDGGNILVFFSVNWNLEEHQQIIERIGPMRQAQSGHKRPVFIHYLLVENTVDYMVLDRLTSKKEIQDILLEALKQRKE
jgi:SNF2 family DNA or RNA helicase